MCASYITGALIPVDGGISLLGGRNYAGDPEANTPDQSLTRKSFQLIP